MGDVTSGCTIREVAPALGIKMILIETAATVDTGDTIALTLANYGITTFTGIYGMVHTTANSVIVAEAPTTAVASGVLTITVGGSAVSDKVRTYLVFGRS